MASVVFSKYALTLISHKQSDIMTTLTPNLAKVGDHVGFFLLSTVPVPANCGLQNHMNRFANLAMENGRL